LVFSLLFIGTSRAYRVVEQLTIIYLENL